MSAIPLALPKTMLPSPEGALSAGVTSQWVKILPNNISSIVSDEVSVPTAVSTFQKVTIGSQPIQFELPTGGPNQFLDVAKSTVSFRVNYQVSTASSANYSNIDCYLQSSAHSYFERIQTYVAGQAVDDVTGLNLAMGEETVYSFNSAERDVNWHLGLLAENSGTSSQNKVQGHYIDSVITGSSATSIPASSEIYSYEIPLMSSLFGPKNKSMVPLGKVGKSQIVLTTPQLAPLTMFAKSDSNGTGAGAKFKMTIDQFAINWFVVTLDDRSSSLLGGALNGEFYAHSITHRVGFGTINASTSGQTSVQIPVRVKSARSLSTRFSENSQSVAGSLNGIYDSKCPLASSINYFIASKQRIPPNPLNLTTEIARAYSHAIDAGFVDDYETYKQRSGLAPNSYCTYVTTGTAVADADKYDARFITAGSSTAGDNLSCFSFAEDLRVTSTSSNYLCGQDLTVSNSFLELSLAKSNTNALNVAFIAHADILYMFKGDGTVSFSV